MTDDMPEPSPAPEPTTDDTRDRTVVPLLRPQLNQPPVPAGEDDDPGPRAA
ncbi:hypothetical protein [Methylobacterium radiodurans]|uniref:hypothetical protein n=1 Tax=Methylobacterium radiodurans TaxID=2202828 RepID=UPI0019529350|nr:hypothetical protein [Methylobacterium radiodurans]